MPSNKETEPNLELAMSNIKNHFMFIYKKDQIFQKHYEDFQWDTIGYFRNQVNFQILR